MTRRATAAILYLVAIALTAGGVWWYAFTEALDRLAAQGRADLSLASDRLVGELQQYRELAILMADHPTLAALLRGEVDRAAADTLLLRTADKTGPLDIHVSDTQGRVVASSGRGGQISARFRGDKPSFRRAMQGALGAHHELIGETGARAYIFAAPVFSARPRPWGVVSVDVSVTAVESAWVGDPQAIFFTDEVGVVFVSNRSELLLRARGPAEAGHLARFGYDAQGLAPFPARVTALRGGYEIWALDGGPYLPARALHLTAALPVIGMTGEILLDVDPALRLAGLQAAMAAALLLGLGAVLYALGERRRALAGQLASEAAANAALEARVAERTAELSAANDRLRRAQRDLVQAGKLAALGQMSAGISHELNQPLMAIRSYAENAGLFLEKGRGAEAAENLGRIGELARRMGRIIKNLRAFARNENEPVGDVDLCAVVDAALELSDTKIARCGVAVDWQRPAAPVIVRGGEVRLQQVAMNLISNACDAMEGLERRELTLTLTSDPGKARLSVADTGPGIAEPERIFDPFYSTKPVGHSEGMGLGLSISYGLVQSFGGAITGRNRAGGGAEFTVELTASREGALRAAEKAA